MCTVSFFAREDGFLLGMNRDEKLARVAGLPPTVREVGGRAAICPSEPDGGTWIGVNDAGAAFALINWYAVAARAPAPAVSRGTVVTEILPHTAPFNVFRALRALPLQRINPFRLIGVFPATHEVIEWRWNLERLAQRYWRWQANTWISSGHDESGAQRMRGQNFSVSLEAPDAGSPAWLRRLHGSHAPERGAFSTCMHRADAATVSYTEIEVKPGAATLFHVPGPLCCTPPESATRCEIGR
jgi:hypothetical protein